MVLPPCSPPYTTLAYNLKKRRSGSKNCTRGKALRISHRGKVYLSEDCTSPVVVPGVMDIRSQAGAAFRKFAAAEMHVVHSVVPMESWPGMPPANG